MFSREDEDFEEAMKLSMITYKREQKNTNTNGYGSRSAGSGDDYSHLFEEAFSDLKDETFEEEERKPRGFQKELIDKILQDHHNYIVFAPTGCGKTFIASSVIKHYLEKKQSQGRKGAVLFIVDRIPLVLQQGKAIQQDIGLQWNITQYCGELGAIENWSLAIRTGHVLVSIAQILLNCLAVNPGALSDVDLLVFDECHHTTKDHPYHQIIKDHWKMLPPKQRPKILGLTASPGGKPDKIKTKERIKSLCENMHSKIIMVQDNIEELKGTVIPPKVLLVNIIVDPYLRELTQTLEGIIKKMEVSSQAPYKWPEKKTSFEYMRFCEQLQNNSQENKNLSSICALNLLLANCIQLLEDVGLDCVIDYLEAKKSEGEWTNEISMLLTEFKKRWRPGLMHGKRDTLLRTLSEIQAQPGFKRGIIFVKTRASAHALLQTIAQHLHKFRPCLLVGHGAKGEAGGMNAKSQKNIVSDFNNGTSNLMVATSVAEEGLDIQACNTVIRYDALDTAEALIQSRGRARFHDSTFIVMLSGADSKRFYDALESEKNMHDVVSELLKKPGSFYDFLNREDKKKHTFGDYDDFEIIPAQSTTPYRPNLVLHNSTNSITNNTSPSGVISTEVIKEYGNTRGAIPRYMIKSTKSGFLGEAFMDLEVDGYSHTINAEEVYGKTQEEVKIQLNEALTKQLYNMGELEELMTKFQFSSPPHSSTHVSSPLRLSAPPTSSPSRPPPSTPSRPPPSTPSRPPPAQIAYKPAPLSSFYPGIHSSPLPPSSSLYPGTYSSSLALTSSPSSSLPRTSSSTKQLRPPNETQIEKVNSKLRINGKTAISALFEYCQGQGKPTPTKECNSVSPFSCTIIMEGGFKYTGPPCLSKKEAEHSAAKHVLALLNVF